MDNLKKVVGIYKKLLGLGITILFSCLPSISFSQLINALNSSAIDIFSNSKQEFLLDTVSHASLTTYTGSKPNGVKVELVFIKIPLNQAKMEVHEIGREVFCDTYTTVCKQLDSTLVVVNGGYYGENRGHYYPLGLIIIEGKKRSSSAKWNNTKYNGGTIAVQRNTIMLNRSILPTTSSVSFALQCYPVLVDSAKITVTKSTPQFNRTAIGQTSKGDILVAGMFSSDYRAATLYEFASILLHKEITAQWCLAMDGGPSSHIYIPRIKRHFGQCLNMSLYLPNLVSINKKELKQ